MGTTTQSADVEPIIPRIHFAACPIRESLGIFGRKWALLILRDLAFLKIERFSKFLKNNPGLTPRVLSMRLRDLENEGLVERMTNSGEPRDVRYRLTRKGHDSIPILTAFILYGIQHRAERVFEDGKPRRLVQVFPERRETMLGELASYAASAKS